MEPTREQLDKAWHLEGATPAIIAEALADEFARGRNEALEYAAKVLSLRAGTAARSRSISCDLAATLVRALKGQP